MPIPHPTPHRPHRPTAHPPHRPPHRPAPPQPLQPRPPHLWAYFSPSRAAELSRSKTKNFDRLTSESSSSPRVITGSVCRDDAFSAGATPVADAPPAIAKDIPAAPQTGKAFLECFRFETGFVRAMVNLHMGHQMPSKLALFGPPCHTGEWFVGRVRSVARHGATSAPTRQLAASGEPWKGAS